MTYHNEHRDSNIVCSSVAFDLHPFDQTSLEGFAWKLEFVVTDNCKGCGCSIAKLRRFRKLCIQIQMPGLDDRRFVY